MSNLKTWALSLVLVTGLSGSVLNTAWADHTYQHSEQQMDSVFNQLNLTPEQKQRIQAIKAQSRAEAQSHRSQMHTMKSQFTDDVFGTNASLPLAEGRVDQMAEHMRQMGKLRVRTLFKIKTVLTPEQNQQFARLWKEKRDTMHDTHKGGHHGQKP